MKRTKNSQVKKPKHSTKRNTTKNSKKMKDYGYSQHHYNSNDGIMTSIWGPSLWHSIHAISFNYPVHPTLQQKNDYYQFIMSLGLVLPCGKCRDNFKQNIIDIPFTMETMKSRHTFSKYVYDLHEHINSMLGKMSGLTYDMVRDRYEMFRARCKEESEIKETGCVDPIIGVKTKCILRVIPNDSNVVSLDIDSECLPK